MAFELDFLESYDLDSVIAELKRIARKLRKRTLTRKDIDTHGRVNSFTVRKKFGTMQQAHEAAGLLPPRRRLTDKEMLGLIAQLWKSTYKQYGHSPSIRELEESRLPVSAGAIIRRFGTWNKAIIAAAKVAPGELKRPKEFVPKPPYRPEISDRKRFLVFKRDGYRCKICKRVGGELELDHIIPVSRGGSDKTDNLQTLCKKCNRGKSGDLQ